MASNRIPSNGQAAHDRIPTNPVNKGPATPKLQPSALPGQEKPIHAKEESKKPHGKRDKSVSRQFKLISVDLKEAALDSPTFRASSNHLDIQVENVERWINALVSSSRRFPQYLRDIQTFYNSFLEHLVPSFLQDGLIDQEYTVQSLRSSLDGCKEIWGMCLSFLQINTSNIETLYTTVSQAINNYKEVRTKFESNQGKYEQYLSIFMSTSKNKDAQMAVADAQELYKVRKAYIHSSLDLVVELSQLGNLLDRQLVLASTNLWSNKTSVVHDVTMPHFRALSERIKSIQSWSDSYAESISKFRKDMHISRTQVEELAAAQALPSMNPDDYKSTTINQRMLGEVNEPGLEKHGYLYMKTWPEGSTKPMWVRRWCFIKGGVFGMLVLSPSGTFVQETDKIGILLCNSKYYANEDRRFCFEVKTSGLQLVLQAESLNDLKSWLKVMENERAKTVHNVGHDSHMLEVASGRFPPLISEFASTQPTVVDQELSSTKCVNNEGKIIVSNDLSSYITKNEKFFLNHLYYQIPTIRPPFMTGTTKTSIIAYLITPATSLPTALTANIWGSVNWGIYYLQDVENQNQTPLIPYSQLRVSEEQSNSAKPTRAGYPAGYPEEMIAMDIQMRALFETAVDPEDYCLLSFRCIWSPNSRQDLSGWSFVTTQFVFFYMMASGFVVLFKQPVNHMVSVDHLAHSDFHLLKIYNIDSSVKVKLFLDDGWAVQKKLLALIDNATSNKSKPIEKLVNEMIEIDRQAAAEQNDRIQIQIISQLSRKLVCKDRLVELINPKGKNLLELGHDAPSSSIVVKPTSKRREFKTNFSDEFKYCCQSNWKISPKAIFHALLGDSSILLQETSSFAKIDGHSMVPWYTTTKDGQASISRCFNVKTHYNRRKQQIQIKQVVDNMFDDEYYTITHKMSSFEFFVGSRFSIESKFVIIGIPGKQSQLYFYTRRNFDGNSPFNPIIDELCQGISFSHSKEIEEGLHKVEKQIGSHGMVAKSIYYYGKLTVTEEPYQQPPVPTIYYNMLDVFRVIFERTCLAVVALFVWFVRSILRLTKSFFHACSLNRMLIVLCAVSGIVNLFLIGRSTVNYWAVSKAEAVAKEFVNQDPVNIQTSVYMSDVYDMLETKYNVEGSASFALFKNVSYVLNYDVTSSWANQYTDKTTRESARRLSGSLQDIAVRRNDLLTELRILNSMEMELAMAEHRNWLVNELKHCSELNQISWSDISKENGSTIENIAAGMESIREYCLDVQKQLNLII